MIDQNRDGFIEKEDLHDMLASLGKNPSDDYLEAMMNEAPGPINFTMFLTLFGERLQGTDPEDVIKNAFGCFDEDNNGLISEDRLRELLTTMGDRFTDEDVSQACAYEIELSHEYLIFCRSMRCIVKPQSETIYSITSNLPEFLSMERRTRANNRSRVQVHLLTSVYYISYHLEETNPQCLKS